MVNRRETIDPYLKESRVLRAVPANTREALNDLKGSKITQHAKYCCFFAVFFYSSQDQQCGICPSLLQKTVAIFLAGQSRDLTEYNIKHRFLTAELLMNGRVQLYQVPSM